VFPSEFSNSFLSWNFLIRVRPMWQISVVPLHNVTPDKICSNHSMELLPLSLSPEMLCDTQTYFCKERIPAKTNGKGNVLPLGN
jgi:hypothetical protein